MIIANMECLDAKDIVGSLMITVHKLHSFSLKFKQYNMIFKFERIYKV